MIDSDTLRTYSRADVATHCDRGWQARPAVNVKLHAWPDPFTDDLLASVARECGASPADFVAWWRSHDDDALSELIDGRDCYGWSYFAASDGFDMAQEDADLIFDRYTVKVWQEGRMGGWLVVDGLPDLNEWDAVMLGKWRRFERYVRAIRDDQWRRVVDLVCRNTYARETAAAERVAESVTATAAASSWMVAS